MSKQIYIDSNGNEIQVSGTVNTADMMPMSGNDSTKVSEAIGSLSTLTTTDKSSIVGAVNEVNGGKVANVAFDSSTMFADISTAVKNAFNLSECYCYVLKNGNVCTVTLRFKCANAIVSGSFNITGLTPCQIDIASALASLDNKGGYMQLSGTVLYIRCSASSSQYLAGSITYPTYTN